MKTSQQYSTLQAWMLATRPKTLFAGISPVFLGIALAYYFTQNFNLLIALLSLVCVVLMQIGTNLVNDYFDAADGIDDEARLGPKRSIHLGLLEAKQVKRGYQICFVLAFFIGLYLIFTGGGLIIAAIGLSSLLMAYLYTGGPFPLSRYALGEVSAAFFFGPIAVWGSAYLQAPDASEIMSLSHFLYGLGAGWVSAAIMAINNLRDRQSDNSKNKYTLAVFLGESKARLLVILFILLSAMWNLFYAFSWQNYGLLISLIATILFFKNWVFILRAPIEHKMNMALGKTGMYLFVCALLTSAAFIAGA